MMFSFKTFQWNRLIVGWIGRFVLSLTLGLSFAARVNADSQIDADLYPKESCGMNSTIKKFSFAHQGALIDDDATLEFTPDGGFKLYDENEINHLWVLDADGFVLTRRILTTGMRDYQTYNLDSMPSVNFSPASANPALNWTSGVQKLIYDLAHMEITLVERDQPIEHVRTALYCAHKILINALARGHEQLLHGKTNTQF